MPVRFLSVQMILMWTHGQSLMEAKAGVNWKKILCNINLIAIILGIVLFFTQIRLPVISWKRHEPDLGHSGTGVHDHAWNDHDGGKLERYFQPFQDLSDHDPENGGDSADHTAAFEISASGSRW